MTEQQKLDNIIDTANNLGLDFFEYSGRGMHGSTCIAVKCDYPEDVTNECDVPGARVDNLGKRSVVYWPNVPFDDGRAYRG